MATWPDTVVESPDGARTTFTLTSGLTPVNPIVTVGGLTVQPASIGAGTITLSFAPVVGESPLVYFTATGAAPGSPGTVTLASLRLQARQRADMVNSLFVSDSELTGYINSKYTELYDLLVQKFGDDYFVADPYTFTTTGAELYPLPTDLYKLKGLEVQNGSQWFDVPKMGAFSQRNRGGVSPYSDMRYRLLGGKIMVRSGSVAPSSGRAMRMWYVPRPTLLANDSDSIDGVSGWEEYVVVSAAISCLAKEESDTTGLERQLAGLTQRIEAAAENRDEGAPQTVADVRRGFDWPTWENP